MAVRYCAEPFENDGSLSSVLLKSLKRAMAAEYSRELSDKVIRTKRGLALQGYWPGGNPGLGLRRCVILGDGRLGAPLAPGEANAIKGNRVIVVPGPAEEVAVLRRLFHLFVTTKTTPNALARRLNAEGANAGLDRPWTQARARRALSNELYIGTHILGRAEVRFGRSKRRPRETWLRVPGMAEPIVSQRVFREAQRRTVHHRRYTDAEMLDALRTMMREGRAISHYAIQRDPRAASPSVYRSRFGTLAAIYERIGYIPTPKQQALADQIAACRPPGGRLPLVSRLSDDEVIQRLSALRAQEGGLCLEMIEVTPGLPRVRNLLRRFGTIERAYALAGHVPNPVQRKCLDRPRRRAAAIRSRIPPL
ncbi:MAG: recombinase family protein [Phenylobacterium sp.]